MITLESSLAFDAATHRYFLDGVAVPNVTRVLEAAGLIDYRFLGERRELYLARGRAVHEATCRHDDHSLAEETLSDEILGYVEAWRAFRRDFAFVPELIEHRIWSSRYGFAGTLDRAGRIRCGGQVIVDLKTGSVPDWTRFQLAAYASALDHPRAWQRRAVELHQVGTYKVFSYTTGDFGRDFNVFLRALETFRSKEK